MSLTKFGQRTLYDTGCPEYAWPLGPCVPSGLFDWSLAFCPDATIRHDRNARTRSLEGAAQSCSGDCSAKQGAANPAHPAHPARAGAGAQSRRSWAGTVRCGGCCCTTAPPPTCRATCTACSPTACTPCTLGHGAVGSSGAATHMIMTSAIVPNASTVLKAVSPTLVYQQTRSRAVRGCLLKFCNHRACAGLEGAAWITSLPGWQKQCSTMSRGQHVLPVK